MEYFPLNSQRDFSRQKVSQRVSDRIICMTPGETVSETCFFTRAVKTLIWVVPEVIRLLGDVRVPEYLNAFGYPEYVWASEIFRVPEGIGVSEGIRIREISGYSTEKKWN